jgi:hypothetical protein
LTSKARPKKGQEHAFLLCSIVRQARNNYPQYPELLSRSAPLGWLHDIETVVEANSTTTSQQESFYSTTQEGQGILSKIH